MKSQDYFQLGTIIKCNRKTGELSIHARIDAPELLDELRVLFVEIDGGPVPFFIHRMRQKSNDVFQVLFEDYDDPERAQRLVDSKVFLPAGSLPENGQDRFSLENIEGYEIIDQTAGSIGIIEEVLEAPGQDLIRVMHQGTEVLIPVVDEFFVSIDNRTRRIVFDLPEGLLGLYLED